MEGVLRAYLDNAATTPMSAAAAAAMLAAAGADPEARAAGRHANPSAVHRWGVQARAAVDQARRAVAALLGARAEEIVFTSGGTEANHLALLGLCQARARQGRHILTTALEHSSVRTALAVLRGQGFTVSELPVSSEGLLAPQTVAQAVRPDTILCTLAHVNNEIGTVQPVEQIARVLKAAGRNGPPPALHVDAVQALGKVPVPYAAWGVDLASLSAHKIGGPKGVGALYVRAGVRLLPPVPGGSQEGGLRPGTENVPGIVAMGVATAGLQGAGERMRQLKLRLWNGLRQALPALAANGPDPQGQAAAPHILNLTFHQVSPLPAEVILHLLEAEGIAASAGSACSARSGHPSHVLQALGLPAERVRASLRFSLGPETRVEEIDWAVERIPRALQAAAVPRV